MRLSAAFRPALCRHAWRELHMRYSTLEQDFRSGLALLRDASDPPRYYIRQGRRLELIAIGNEASARSRYALRCCRTRRAQAASPAAATGWRVSDLANYRKPAEGPPQNEVRLSG